MRKLIKSLLQKKEEIKAVIIPDYIVFNVENFNAWFKDKNNNAVYANEGIFLRLDKLSESDIEDYLEKCYGVTNCEYEKIREFHNAVRENWMKIITEG